MNPNTPSLSQPHHSLAFSIYEYPSFQTSHPDMSLTGFGYIVVSPRSSVWTPRGWNALQHPHYISATFLLSFYNLRASHTPGIPSWHVPDRFRVHGGISRALILDPKGTKLTPTPPLYISAISLLSFYNLRASYTADIPSWHVPDRFRVHSGIPRALGLSPEVQLTSTDRHAIACTGMDGRDT